MTSAGGMEELTAVCFANDSDLLFVYDDDEASVRFMIGEGERLRDVFSRSHDVRRIRDWLTGWLQEHGHEAEPVDARSLAGIVDAGKVRFGDAPKDPSAPRLAASERASLLGRMADLRRYASEAVYSSNNGANHALAAMQVHDWLKAMADED